MTVSLEIELDDANDLISFIFENLPDDEVDAIGLNRITSKGSGIAREPVTVGAVLTLTPILAIAVIKLVERWMEANRQREAMRLIYATLTATPEVGKTLAELEAKHADVMTKYVIGMPSLPKTK